MYVWYMYKNVYDTGRTFEPIFMKLTRLVRVYPRVNSIVFGNNRPNKTTYIGENVPLNQFFGFKSDGMSFLRKKLKNSIPYIIFYRKAF